MIKFKIKKFIYCNMYFKNEIADISHSFDVCNHFHKDIDDFTLYNFIDSNSNPCYGFETYSKEQYLDGLEDFNND